MTSQWTYTITHYDESNSWASTVINSYDVDSIPLFTDQGSGEINRAIIRLNAPNGKFITQNPIIDQFDKIRIQATDGQGGTYNRVFEVIEIVPSEDNAQGTLCQVECLGNEWYLQYIHYVKPHFFETAYNVLKDIGNAYNSDPATKANGGKMPDLQYHDKPYNPATTTDSNGTPPKLGNGLPSHTVGIYDYGTSETPMYDVMIDVNDRQGSSVDLGGVLDFFELGFDTDTSNLHKIYMRAFSSGLDPEEGGETPVTIDGTTGGSSVNTNLDESEGGISAQRATRVLSWGELGAIPNDWSRYLAEEVDFIFRPTWDSGGIRYYADSKVTYNGKHYRALINHVSAAARAPPSSGSNTWWTTITFASEVGDVIQYSPYTDDKVNIYKHVCEGTKIFDGNLVINYVDQEDSNKNFFRTWVHHTTNETGSTPNPYFYDASSPNGDPPRGFRWLNIVPNVIGTDPETGKTYTDSIIEYTGGSTFKIKYDPRDVGAGMQVAVLSTAKVYQWNGSAWVDISSSTSANDCFHPFTTIANIDGQQQGTPIGLTTKNFTVTNVQSAVEVTNTFTTIKDLITGDYYKAYAGLSFGYPFPFKTNAAYSERVGSLYGSPTTGEPATFDPQNMHYTPSGNRNFNQDDSEELGTVTGLSFFCRVKYELGNTTNRDGKELLVANIPVRVTCYDTSDNVVVQDISVPFRNNWYDMYYPLSGFKIYRGAVPIFKSNGLDTLIRPKEQEAANVFEWRNLKLVSIQVQSFFDEHGRYSPLREITTGEFLSPQTQIPMFGATVKLAIDALRWTKRNLASSGQDTERNIEAPFVQRNQVFSYNQLKKDAVAQQQIEAFRHRDYVIGTQGKFDIRFGSSFLYKNPRTVYLPVADRTESGEAENTIQLVAKKIEYSITKANKGKGGFLRRIHGVKRFN